MKILSFVFVAPMLVACSSSSSPSAPIADGGPVETHDASVEDAAAPVDAAADVDASPPIDASPGTTYLRLLNLSPDAPALDLCAAREGNATFVGPLLGTPEGIAYGQGTQYLPLVADYYDVRVVAAGSKDCSVSVGSFAVSLPSMEPGAHATIAAEGDLQVAGSDASFGVYYYRDDSTSADASELALRFVNASSSLDDVDFGFGTLGASTFSSLFVDTTFSHAGRKLAPDAGVVDGEAYLDTGAPTAATMSAHLAGGSSDAVSASSVTASAGAVVTMFLIGGKTGDAVHPSQILMCDDNAAPSGAFANCSIVSP